MTTTAIPNLTTVPPSPTGGGSTTIPGDATNLLAGIFAQLLEGQLQPDAGTIIGSVAQDALGRDQKLADETSLQSDPAALAAWLSALPNAPTVNPENRPKLEFLAEDQFAGTTGLGDGPSLLGRQIDDGRNLGVKDLSPVSTTIAQAAQSTSSETAGSVTAHGASAIIAADETVSEGTGKQGNIDGIPNTPTASETKSLTFAQHLGQAKAGNESTIPVPLHSPQWENHFAEKVVWLARNDQQTAQINIAPPQLGPIQVTVSLNGDQATTIFASPHAEVRQAIESALPQLREMLASAGISLGNSSVGSQLAQQNPAPPFPNPQSTNENAILASKDKGAEASNGIAIQHGRGLVDLFA